MSLSAGQVPEEGQHGPGTGGKYLSQKPSPLYVFSPSSPHGRITRGNSCQEHFESPRSRAHPRDPRVAALPHAEVQVPSSGTRGPVGQTGVPSSLAASLALPTAAARRFPAALPSSPQRHPLPSPHSPFFPPLCSLLPRSPLCFFSPLSHVPPFPCPCILPFLHAGSGLWPPPPGTVTRCSRLQGQGLQSH